MAEDSNSRPLSTRRHLRNVATFVETKHLKIFPPFPILDDAVQFGIANFIFTKLCNYHVMTSFMQNIYIERYTNISVSFSVKYFRKLLQYELNFFGSVNQTVRFS